MDEGRFFLPSPFFPVFGGLHPSVKRVIIYLLRAAQMPAPQEIEDGRRMNERVTEQRKFFSRIGLAYFMGSLVIYGVQLGTGGFGEKSLARAFGGL